MIKPEKSPKNPENLPAVVSRPRSYGGYFQKKILRGRGYFVYTSLAGSAVSLIWVTFRCSIATSPTTGYTHHCVHFVVLQDIGYAINHFLFLISPRIQVLDNHIIIGLIVSYQIYGCDPLCNGY